jgi:hypothetical protein
MVLHRPSEPAAQTGQVIVNPTYQDVWEMASTLTCEEGGHNGVNHARRNKNGVFGWVLRVESVARRR